jgi:hypothetical protein
MPSVDPGRVIVTAAISRESRAGAEGAQQDSGIRQPFSTYGYRSSPELGDSTSPARAHNCGMRDLAPRCLRSFFEIDVGAVVTETRVREPV